MLGVNKLFSVFLRVLEYYAGILFLTTNRIGDFDEAFASRIHMSLHYPALDQSSTVKVFQLNLDLIKNRLKDRVKIDQAEIITAAAEHWRQHKDARWNGRQIRNACQTALALAEFDAQPQGKKYDIKEKTTAKVHLKLSHLEVVSKAYLEFTDYLKAVNRGNAEWRAHESGLRALDKLFEALKSERGQKKDRSGRSSSRDRRSGSQDARTQAWRLRSDSSGHHPPPPAPTPSTPEPVHNYPVNPAWSYSGQRPGYEPPSSHAPRTQYHQEAYTPSPSHGVDPRTGLSSSAQWTPAASHLQAPQQYAGSMQASQAHYTSQSPAMPQTQSFVYPSPPPGLGGAREPGGSSPRYHGNASQSGQDPRGIGGSFPGSEQM